MAVCEEEKQNYPTPRVQCHGREEAKLLEQILNKVKQGDLITQVIRAGSVVYVHLVDEKLG